MVYIPFVIIFAITGRCNLKCKHCVAKDSWKNEVLSTEEIFDIIRQLVKIKVFHMSIFGGEPFIREDFFDIIKFLNKHPISITINTNGMLITKEIAQKLVTIKNIKRYDVSLDGPEIIHEKIRGKGSFNATISGILNLISFGSNVMLSVTINKINLRNLKDIVMIGKELGVRCINFRHTFYGGNAKCFLDDLYVPKNEEKLVCEEIYELSKKYPGFIKGSYLQLYELLKQVGKHKVSNRFLKINPCGAGTRECAIRPDGFIIPCDTLWEVKAGNLRKQKFIDIWKNSKVLKEFRRPKVIDLNEYPECKGCEYQFICFTGHRCSPYYYPNGLKDKKLYCWKFHE
jgi:radical SAM protein with 4Fe4S-binding SPASM domain